MEEQKLTRKKKKALHSSNRRVLAEACNDLANFYYKQNRYDDALEEYKHEASILKELGLRLEWGTCNRMIGEMYMLMAEFEKALKYEERHLAIAKELENLVEEQRAMATLGRIYLLQGQSSNETAESICSLKAAEKAFMKSLVLCESLKGKINTHELMDMRARLLLNIGVALEHMGNLDKAVGFMEKAISICSNQDLYEVLHQCYVTVALLHSNRSKDYAKALSCLNKALEVASRLEEKIIKQCETLSMKGDILCKMSDYQSAKQVLFKAWKMNTPDEDEKSNIEKNLKIVAAMCYAEDLLISTDPTDHLTFKKLYEKLGDGACLLHNYPSAAEFYLKMLEHAELAGESGKSLIPIYVSLYQTYKDMGSYNEALQFYEKEYELIKDVAKEAYTTLYNIAEASYMAKRPYEQVEKACLGAREAARKRGNRKHEVKILKNLLKYQEEYIETDQIDVTKEELRLLGYYDFGNLENSEDDEMSSAGCTQDNTTNVGDDICLDDLSDLSDNNDEEVMDTKRETRKRGRGYTIKKNMKGETQLHIACISGNKLLVERLIANGHPVNVRDNAGWLPLHEACIHGQIEVANMLINHGAHINDRGGSNCDGITPLYDAASNGHLELVQLLLDKGAIPSLKTDFGETPLHVLQKWRAETILNKSEESFYKSICDKINMCIEKRNVSDSTLNRSKSKTPVKASEKYSPPSHSKSNNKIDRDVPMIRRRNLIDDDDSDIELDLTQNINQPEPVNTDESSKSSVDSFSDKPKEKKSAGVNEYKNAISALRSRNILDDSPEEDFTKNKAKPALLLPDEVDDDWLEDDLGGTKTSNKRKYCDDILTISSKKPSIESIKDTIDSINSIGKPLTDTLNKSNITKSKTKSRLNDLIDTDNSSDSDLCIMTENIKPDDNSFKNIIRSFNDSRFSGDSRQNIKKRWKRQSTLLKAGFQRKKEIGENDMNCSSNSNSDCETTEKRLHDAPNKEYLALSKSLTRNLSRDNLNLTNHTNISRSQFGSLNGSNINSTINAVRNIGSLQTPVLAPAAVRVKVEDKTLLISLPMKNINGLTISWLVDEIKTRYYRLTGVRPVFSLMTSDGAILSEEDPLSLVLSSLELKTCVTNWKASPAEERYLECCEALSIATSEEIQQAIGRSVSTHRLALGAKTLTSNQIRPLFRALTHQSHITAIMLYDNNLGDEGMKSLVDCLCTLKLITHLDLSNCNITAEGTKTLLNLFEKSSRPICQSLEHVNVSGNPIGDDGFKNIVHLGHFVRLKLLRMTNCRVTDNALRQVEATDIRLDKLESLDISNNCIKQVVANSIISMMNPNLLVELDLQNVGVEGNFVGFLSTFLDTATDLKLRKINLSHWKLVDSQFMRIYRCLGRAKNLQSISLEHNAVTFITLKKLLQRQPPVPQINLEGCHDIFKFSQDSDFQVWLPAVDFGRCIPEINVTPVSKTEEERESVKAFARTWLTCFKGRGVIEHAEGGVVRYTAR